MTGIGGLCHSTSGRRLAELTVLSVTVCASSAAMHSAGPDHSTSKLCSSTGIRPLPNAPPEKISLVVHGLVSGVS